MEACLKVNTDLLLQRVEMVFVAHRDEGKKQQ
jgi:hypothetical protein